MQKKLYWQNWPAFVKTTGYCLHSYSSSGGNVSKHLEASFPFYWSGIQIWRENNQEMERKKQRETDITQDLVHKYNLVNDTILIVQQLC